MQMEDFFDGDETIVQAVQRLYESEPRTILSISVTGGGVKVMEMLCTVPGASRCLMDAQIPYARSALQAQLSTKTNTSSSVGAVNNETAIAMAQCARNRAIEIFLADSGDITALQEANILGLACTAALVSAQPKKGLHRCHVACASQDAVATYAVVLDKGRRTRAQEDEACSHLLLDALLDNAPSVRGVTGVPLTLSRRLLEESVLMERAATGDPLDNLYAGKTKKVLFQLKNSAKQSVLGDATASMDSFDCLEDVPLPAGTVVYAGSFSPLHRGHVQLAQAARSEACTSARQRATDGESSPKLPILVFEIAAINADKPALAREEVLRRVFALLRSLPADVTNAAVCVTSEPLFIGKAALFRGCTFVLGADTMIRLLDPKYYGRKRDAAGAGQPTEASAEAEAAEQQRLAQTCELISALATFAMCDVQFVVGGRQQVTATGSQFLSCEDILRLPQSAPIPLPLKRLFHGIAETRFREDISSTQIRREQEALRSSK